MAWNCGLVLTSVGIITDVVFLIVLLRQYQLEFFKRRLRSVTDVWPTLSKLRKSRVASECMVEAAAGSSVTDSRLSAPVGSRTKPSLIVVFLTFSIGVLTMIAHVFSLGMGASMELINLSDMGLTFIFLLRIDHQLQSINSRKLILIPRLLLRAVMSAVVFDVIVLLIRVLKVENVDSLNDIWPDIATDIVETSAFVSVFLFKVWGELAIVALETRAPLTSIANFQVVFIDKPKEMVLYILLATHELPFLLNSVGNICVAFIQLVYMRVLMIAVALYREKKVDVSKRKLQLLKVIHTCLVSSEPAMLLTDIIGCLCRNCCSTKLDSRPSLPIWIARMPRPNMCFGRKLRNSNRWHGL